MEKNNILVYVLAVLLVLSLGFIVYDKVITKETCVKSNDGNQLISENTKESSKIEEQEQISRSSENVTESKVDAFDQLVGTYEFNQNDEIRTLNVNSDGTGEYLYKDKCGDDKCTYQNVKGTISIGKDKIYLMDNSCEAIVLNNSCSYPNCNPITVFDYNNNVMTIDGRTLAVKK